MNFRLVILFLILFNTGCSLDCNYDEELENVKSLSEVQLKEVFEFIEKYSLTLENEYTNVDIASESLSIPHINYVVGGISKNIAYLKLGGCYDDKAIVNISGYGESSKEKNNAIITVISGEDNYSQKIVLWKKD